MEESISELKNRAEELDQRWTSLADESLSLYSQMIDDCETILKSHENFVIASLPHVNWLSLQLRVPYLKDSISKLLDSEATLIEQGNLQWVMRAHQCDFSKERKRFLNECFAFEETLKNNSVKTAEKLSETMQTAKEKIDAVDQESADVEEQRMEAVRRAIAACSEPYLAAGCSEKSLQEKMIAEGFKQEDVPEIIKEMNVDWQAQATTFASAYTEKNREKEGFSPAKVLNAMKNEGFSEKLSKAVLLSVPCDWQSVACEKVRGMIQARNHPKFGYAEMLKTGGFSVEQSSAAVATVGSELIEEACALDGATKSSCLDYLTSRGFLKEDVNGVLVACKDQIAELAEKSLKARYAAEQGSYRELRQWLLDGGYSKQEAEKTIECLQISWLEPAVQYAQKALSNNKKLSKKELAAKLKMEYSEQDTEKALELLPADWQSRSKDLAASIFEAKTLTKDDLAKELAEAQMISKQEALQIIDELSIDWAGQARRNIPALLEKDWYSAPKLIRKLQLMGFDKADAAKAVEGEQIDWDAQARKCLEDDEVTLEYNEDKLAAYLEKNGFDLGEVRSAIDSTSTIRTIAYTLAQSIKSAQAARQEQEDAAYYERQRYELEEQRMQREEAHWREQEEAEERRRREDERRRQQEELEARRKADREQRRSHNLYLDARNKYNTAAHWYRVYMDQGKTGEALRFKADMDRAQVDMINSGWKD